MSEQRRWLIWSRERTVAVPGGWKLEAHDAGSLTAKAQREYGIEVLPVSEHEAALAITDAMAQRARERAIESLLAKSPDATPSLLLALRAMAESAIDEYRAALTAALNPDSS